MALPDFVALELLSELESVLELELWSDELELDELESDELESDELESDELESEEPELEELESDDESALLRKVTP